MAMTKTEKIASIEEQIAQLENQRKQLQQQQKEQERKDRTKRLCKRMGLLESLLPDTILLTDEQFQTLLDKTILTEQSRRILEGLTTQGNAADHRYGTAKPRGRGCRRGRLHKGNGLTALADSVLRLSAQKESGSTQNA